MARLARLARMAKSARLKNGLNTKWGDWVGKAEQRETFYFTMSTVFTVFNHIIEWVYIINQLGKEGIKINYLNFNFK